MAVSRIAMSMFCRYAVQYWPDGKATLFYVLHRRAKSSLLAPNGFYKIVEVINIQVAVGANRVVGSALLGLYFFHQLVIIIKDLIIIIAIINQCSFIAINNKSSACSFYREIITTPAFPGDALSCPNSKLATCVSGVCQSSLKA